MCRKVANNAPRIILKLLTMKVILSGMSLAEVTDDVQGPLRTGRGAAVGKKQRERRRFSRVAVGCKTNGRVTALCDASLVDISHGEVLIEHVQFLRPGTTSSLDLDVQGKRLNLKCRVTRSTIQRTEVQADGQETPIYHTRLALVDLPEQTQRVVHDHIHSIIDEANATRADPGEHMAVRRPGHEGSA